MKKNYTLSLDLSTMTQVQLTTKNVSELVDNLLKGYIDKPEDEKLKTAEQLKKLKEEKALIQAEINTLTQEVEAVKERRRIILA